MANGNFADGTRVAGDPYLIEDAFDIELLNKYLIKQGSNYHTIKPEFYKNGEYPSINLDGGLTPNVNDFENYGFVDVGDLVSPRSEIVLSMDEDSIVGEGKTYRKNISGYGKIIGIKNTK